jgi:hypothetical protein
MLDSSAHPTLPPLWRPAANTRCAGRRRITRVIRRPLLTHRAPDATVERWIRRITGSLSKES